MKKIIGVFLLILSLITMQQVEAAEKPDYEKYGNIAITVVQADYPDEEVTDYEYKGRKQLENGQVEDDFLFLVGEKGEEYNVLVKITHSKTNKKLLNLTVEEVKVN